VDGIPAYRQAGLPTGRQASTPAYGGQACPP